MYCGRSHNEICAFTDVFCPMSDPDCDAPVSKSSNVWPFINVRAFDLQSHAFQHLGQRGHGDSADPDQIPFSARGHIILKICHVFLQIVKKG